MVNDPIADMLMRIKNAAVAGNPSTQIPHSDMKMRIANILLQEGFVSSVTKKTLKAAHHKVIEVGIIYDADRTPRVVGLVRVSRPSRRVYSGVAELKPVQQGHGIMILSTPKGILTDKEARKEHVGGEVICKIW
jgi:small subunit ribosomal protein S8